MSAERISGQSQRPDVWTSAAIEAELETGRREESRTAAEASLLVRAARISAGCVISLLGLVLIPLPGPGLFVLAGGLSILAVDVPFARRLLEKVRARMPQDADGGTPNWLRGVMVGAVALGLASSAAILFA